MNRVDADLIAEEARSDPAFGQKLVSMLRQPGGERLLSISARKAMANAFNPKLYPETKGQWDVLRRRAHALAESMPGIVDKIVSKMPFSEKMDAVRAIAQGEQPRMVIAGMGELGQFEIIGSLISTVAGVGGSIYNAKVTASAQQDIAKIQANAAIQGAQAQMAVANAQAAIEQAKAAQLTQAAQIAQSTSPTGFLTKDIGGGVPLWAVPAGIATLGIGAAIFFSTRKKRR